MKEKKSSSEQRCGGGGGAEPLDMTPPSSPPGTSEYSLFTLQAQNILLLPWRQEFWREGILGDALTHLWKRTKITVLCLQQAEDPTNNC